jgi:hypothetical protein
MSIALWCITKNEEFFLDLMIPLMSSYDWIKRILILHTDEISPNYYQKYESDKVVEVYKNFGDKGFSAPVEKNGFDEIACRNFAINFAESLGCEWLLQCDSDEFYTDETGFLFENDKNILNFMCYAYHSPTTGKREQHHIRAWKTHLHLRYSKNPNDDYIKQFPNKTSHCIIDTADEEIINVNDPFFIHCHWLFDFKREAQPKGSYDLPDILPDTYKKAWEDQ